MVLPLILKPTPRAKPRVFRLSSSLRLLAAPLLLALTLLVDLLLRLRRLALVCAYLEAVGVLD